MSFKLIICFNVVLIVEVLPLHPPNNWVSVRQFIQRSILATKMASNYDMFMLIGEILVQTRNTMVMYDLLKRPL